MSVDLFRHSAWTIAVSTVVSLAMIVLAASAEARGAPESFAPLVKSVAPAVVNISTTRSTTPGETDEAGASPFAPGSPWDELFRRFGQPQGPNARPREVSSLGSGFVIDASGYIVTNNHVVARARDISVTFTDGRQLQAKLVGRDDKTDLALLKVESDRPLSAVSWGNSSQVEVGDWVLAVGNPFGLGGTVTAGIISARGRDIHAGPYDDFIQIDASINQGNSGGPSFNMSGEVIGVNTAIFSPTGGNIGIGFAIPSAIAKPVIDELRARGRIERGFIGTVVQPLTPDIAFGLGLKTDQTGALVAQVAPNGPAAKAGVREGDVIVAVDDKAIRHVRDLPRVVAAIKPGATSTLTILRRGSELTLPVTIGVLPQHMEQRAEAPAPTPSAQANRLGLALAPLSPELRRKLDLPNNTRGALVAEVQDGSVAADAGLQSGDVILQVAGEVVAGPVEVERALGKARQQKQESVVLLMTRARNQSFIALKLPRSSS
jgi:serine protease Do